MDFNSVQDIVNMGGKNVTVLQREFTFIKHFLLTCMSPRSLVQCEKAKTETVSNKICLIFKAFNEIKNHLNPVFRGLIISLCSCTVLYYCTC